MGPLLGALIIATISYPYAKQFASTWNIMDIPSARKVHLVPTPRTGGLMIFFSFVLLTFLIGQFMWWYLACTGLIFALGLWEDVFCIQPRIRLGCQLLIGTFFVLAGETYMVHYGIFTLPLAIALPFTIFCIVGVTNAYNIIDGLNGLAAGCAIIFFVLASYLTYIYHDTFLLERCLIITGSLLGFFLFNFPRGRIFMGDGGSYLIGFSVITVSLMATTKLGISPWVFLIMTIIPVFDTLFAIFRRRRIKKSAFKADKRHLHHILKRRYKSGIKTVIVIWSLQLGFALLALLFRENTVALLFLLLLCISFLMRLWLRRTVLIRNFII